MTTKLCRLIFSCLLFLIPAASPANASTNITLVLPSAAAEFIGTITNGGQVVLGGTLSTNVQVQLNVEPPGSLIIPTNVVVVAGQTDVRFDVTILDDALPEESLTNTVTASAWGFGDGRATFRIVDDDPVAYEFTDIASPQYVGVSFTNRLRALDISGQQLIGGGFPVQLRIESSAMTNALSPANLTNGQANLTVTPSAAMNSAELVAEGRAVRGVSGRFNILNPLIQSIGGSIKDAAWVGSTLYALVADGAPACAGSIVTVNPTTGELKPWATVPGGISSTGIFSGQLVASPDGSRLFVTAGLGGTLQAWDLQTGGLSNSYTLNSGALCSDFAVTIADPWRIAMVVVGSGSSDTRIILNGLLQPQTSPMAVLSKSVIADPVLPETFYCFRLYSIEEWKTGPNGVIGQRTLRNGPYTDGFVPMASAEGKLFTPDGYAGDIVSTKMVGTFAVPNGLGTAPWSARIVADPQRREFILASPSGTGITRLQSFGISDLQLHREAFVPLSFSNPRRLLLCGSNRLALVASNTLGIIRWPAGFSESGLPNLAVVPSSAPTVPTLGSNWTWSVTVTNGGLAEATDVRLRVALATNTTLIQIESALTAGRVWTEPGLLHAWLPNLSPGSNAVISFTLRSVSGGWTTNQLSVFGNEDEPGVADNQVTIGTFVLPAGAPESIESMRLAVRELTPDSLRHKVYALERTTATNQTILYELDGTTLAPRVLRVLTGTATHLRLSRDARFLYATQLGGRGLVRVDLSGGEPDLPFETFNPDPKWNYRAWDIEVDPVDSRSVVVAARTELPAAVYETTVACFRDGVKLVKTLSFREYTSTPASGANLEIDPVTRTCVFALHTYTRDVECMAIVPDGLELSSYYRHDGAAAGFILAEGKLYTGYGNEIAMFDGRALRSLPTVLSGYGLVRLDPNTDRLLLVQGGTSGRVQVFDRQNLGRLGVINLVATGSIDSVAILPDSRVALATVDGRVLLLKQSAISGTAPADLVVTWKLQPPNPKVNEPVQITIAVTNFGPSNVVAPAITFEAPANFARQSVVPAAASSSGSYFPYPLLWTGNPLLPGQGRVFEVTGKFTAAGDQWLAAGSADRAVDSTPANNRVSMTLPVAYDLARGQGSSLSFQALDAVRDPYRQGILAIPNGSDSLSGQVVAVDLATGLTKGHWTVGASPTRLVLGDDDRTLYVVIDGGTNVVQVDVQTMAVQRIVPAAQGTNTGLRFFQVVANPGAPHQFAATRSDGKLGFYDPTNSVAPVVFDGGDLAFFATDRLITPRQYYSFVLNRYRRHGSTMETDGSGGPIQIEGLRASLGFVFAEDGRLVDPFNLTQVGEFAASGPAATFAPADLVFFPGTGGLRIFDLHTQALISQESFGFTASQSTADIFHAGGDYVVERLTDGSIFVMRTMTIPAMAPADLSVGAFSTSAWRAGMICDWQISVTNLSGNSAPNTRLDMRLPLGMKFMQSSAPVIYVLEPQASLSLGTLGAGESRTVTVRAVAEKAALSDDLVVSTRSDAVDPYLTNNVARLTKPIAFAQVPNRVDFVPFAVEDMLYEPVGRTLYLASSEFSAATSNAVVALDTTQGIMTKYFPLPGKPGKLAVSPNGGYLYVSLDFGSHIIRFSLPGLETNLHFDTITSTDPYCDMVVLPGNGRSVAVSRHYGFGQPPPSGVVIYDDDVPRPNVIPGGYVSFIQPGLTANTLIGFSGNQFRMITIDSNGLYAQPVTGGTASTSDREFSVGGNNLLAGSEIFNRTTFGKRGTLSASVATTASALSESGDRAVFVGAENLAVNPIFFAGFRTDTLALVGEARAEGMPFEPQKIVLWGDDGIAAFSQNSADGYHFYLGRLDLAGPPSADADLDGMPDRWELEHGLNVGANDARGDFDLDGASNLLEYQSGTNPRSNEEVPGLRVCQLPNKALRLVFPCGGGQHYYIDTNSDLANPNWTPLFDAVSPGGLQSYDVWAVPAAQGYFRIRVAP